jgi:hypothetical protein
MYISRTFVIHVAVMRKSASGIPLLGVKIKGRKGIEWSLI